MLRPYFPEGKVRRVEIRNLVLRRFAFTQSPIPTSGLMPLHVALVVHLNGSAIRHDSKEGAEALVSFTAALIAARAPPLHFRYKTFGYALPVANE